MEKHKPPRHFVLRIYTLHTQDALDFYKDTIYPRHLTSFPTVGIEAHGFWTSPHDVAHKLYVLASLPGNQDPNEVIQRYMKSKEFADDGKGFDLTTIVSVETIQLQPTDRSPLQ